MRKFKLSLRSKQRLIRKGYQVEETKKSISVMKNDGDILIRVYEDPKTGFVMLDTNARSLLVLQKKLEIPVDNSVACVIKNRLYTDWAIGL